MSRIVDVISGVDRNNPDETRAHLYVVTAAGNYFPYCDYGWNRSDGARISILRGWTSSRGTCKICQRRADRHPRAPIIRARPHKTRWL